MDSVNTPNYFEPLNEAPPIRERLKTHSQSSETHPKSKRVFKSTKRKSLTCLVVNCRSVKNKIAEVEVIIDKYKPDIILGNESWLNPDILSSEVFPANYTVYRKERNSKCPGGGVFQAEKNDLIVLHRPDFDSDCEIIWTQCQLAGSNTKSIFFGSFYRSKATDSESLEALQSSLLKMGNILPKNSVILAGDFNAPDINWPNLDSSTYLTSPSERLLEMIDEHDLKQLVESPTRRQGNTQNTLDLVFTNNAGIVSGTEVVPGISDHDMVLFSVKTSCRKKKNVKRKVYIKRKANCSRIKEMLNEFADSFMENLKELSVDEMWDTFECSIRSIMDACIPHKMTSSRYNLPWFNRSLRRQSRAKQRLYNKAKRSQNPQHWSEFRDARKRLHKNLKSAREKYVSDYLGESIKENPKRFWSFVKHLKKDDPGVADFKVDGQIMRDRVMKSDLLNKQFSNVYSKEDLASIPAVGHSPKPTIGSLIVTLPGVIKQLTSLKPNKASGPDQIPPWFLKEYAHEIGPILTLIYQASIDSGIVPSRWKYANVCGVFKGGQKSNPCNYRPYIINLYCV